MFGFGKKNKIDISTVPNPPIQQSPQPPQQYSRTADRFIPEPPMMTTKNYGYKQPPATPTSQIAMRYGIPEAMVEEIMNEVLMILPDRGLSVQDYIELYRLSSVFKDNIWNFIKSHAANKQIDKLQNALVDLDKIDKITAKLAALVPEEHRREIEHDDRQV